MNLEEIVNKAIPLSFPGVKCAATVATETQKAKRRRVELTKAIQSLLANKELENTATSRMDGGNY